MTDSADPLARNLIWIDLEMTGLDTRNDTIIEIATLVTDERLNEVAEGPEIVIHKPESITQAMDEWNTRQHASSGLTERVLESRIDTAEAERRTLEFLRAHTTAGASPMCGNSVCQDRRFLAREMPELERWFHYRNLDVSSLKILAERWRPDVAAGFTKESRHRALEDIRDSVAELVHYRQNLLGLDPLPE